MVESSVLERIRGSLLEKRQALTGWLGATPAPQRRARLGPAGDGAVLAQIQLIDETLDKAEDGCGRNGSHQAAGKFISHNRAVSDGRAVNILPGPS